jgi:hypothetical protein
VKGAAQLPGLIGSLPLAEDTGEAAGVEDAVGRAVTHLEEILAEVALIQAMTGRAGPFSFEHDFVESEPLRRERTCVDVVHAQRALGRCRSGDGGERQDKAYDLHGELSQDSAQ